MSEKFLTIRVRAEIADFRRQMDQASAAVTSMASSARAAGQQTSTAMTQTQAAAAAARASLHDAGKAAQEAAQGFGLGYNAAGQLTDEFGNMVTEAHAAELGLDTASEATREFAAQQQHAAASAGEATTNMGRLAASARDNEEAWSHAGGTLLAFGAAVVAGVGLAIAKYAEFDKAMSEVRAATHETAGNMDLLREAAISAGADTSFSATEAADAITELSKAGVKTKDILAGGLAGALSLAAAGSLGVADAAELAATAMTQFKLKGSDLPHVADLLAAGAGKAQGSVEDMGMALKQGGLVAAATGLSIEETTGALAAFASAGLVGSDAGTSMKTMLQALTPSSKEAKAEMERLGISAYDAQGNFIGMSQFAGNLQTSLSGLTDEQRAATQKIIFGSDAVRASNVLYEQGEAGIAGWIDAVNESGFAAATAAIKQDNLAGDLEKLGGSFDTVLIKGGGGAATALRGVVQGFEGMIDALGGVKPEILSLFVGFAGVTGGASLLAGGFLTLLPKLLSARAAFQTLSAANAPLAAGLGSVGKAAGIAMVAVLALQTAGAIFTKTQTKSVEEYANAIQKVSNAATGAKSSDLDSVFQGFNTLGDIDYVQVDNLADSIRRLTHPDDADGITKGWEPLTDFLQIPKGEISQLEGRLKGLGDALGDITSNGGAASAAKTFNLLTKEFEKNGKGAQDALNYMPGYKDALLKVGRAAGMALEPNELLELAAGKIPARMAAAQTATEGQAAAAEISAVSAEALAKGLEEVGLSASGAITNLDNFTKTLFAAGLLSLSASEAAIGYQDAIDKMTESVVTNGTSLDINTEKGRANQSAYNNIAKSAMTAMEATAAETLATQGSAAAQDQLQASLQTSYDDLIRAAAQLGIVGDEADTMARKALGIPKEVPINTWVNDKASSVLDSVKGKADSLDGKQVLINIREETHRIAYEKRVVDSGGNEPEGGGLYGSDRGGATGGKVSALMGFAGGGKVPGRAPRDLTTDNILAMVNGKPFGLQSEEWIINGRQSKANDRWLRAVNDGLNLDDVFAAQYAAPSKSLAGGYGQAQSFSGYGGSSAAAAAPSWGDINVMVTNPFTGEQVRGIVTSVARQEASGAIAAADGNSRFTRTGRQG